jgi:hypothetical protein
MVTISPGGGGGRQTLFEMGEEDFADHRDVDDKRSGHAVLAQAGDKSGHLPVTVSLPHNS